MKQVLSLISIVVLSSAMPAACAGPSPNGAALPGTQPPSRPSTSSSCLTSTCFYVVSSSGTANARAQAFPANSNGHVAPAQHINGPKTLLFRPGGVAVDTNHQIYVVTRFGNNANDILIYPPGSNGNVKPQTISGSNTLLTTGVNGVATDASNNIYVAAEGPGPSGADAVAVFAAGSTGNVAPARVIGGPNTGLDFPNGITVDALGNVYVANHNAGSVTVYAAAANGNASPVQTISGSNTGLSNVYGVAVDASQNIYVTNQGGTGVFVFAAGANGNVSPIRTITGTKTKLTSIQGIALDGSGNIYVTNGGAPSSVLVFAAGAHGNVKPIQRIAGSLTGFSKVTATGIAVR